MNIGQLVKELKKSFPSKVLTASSPNDKSDTVGTLNSTSLLFNLILLAAIIPVSEPEKKADIITRKAINAKRIQRGISFNLTCSQGRKRCEKSVQQKKILFLIPNYNNLWVIERYKHINFH